MANNDENFTGASFIVTGASSGIGLETVKALALLNGADIILTCRDIEKAEKVTEQIR